MKTHTFFFENHRWTGGAFGTGKRCPLKVTRKIVDSIHDGSLAKCEFKKSPVFNLSIPTALEGVPSELLEPSQAWADKAAYQKTNEKLAGMFSAAFERYSKECAPEGKLLHSSSSSSLTPSEADRFSVYSRRCWT